MTVLIITFVLLVITACIVRALRERYKAVDYVISGLIITPFAVTWIISGFWWAVLAGVISLAVVGLMFIPSPTKITRRGRVYTFKCNECGYEKLDITADHGDIIRTRCRRCGKVVVWHLDLAD